MSDARLDGAGMPQGLEENGPGLEKERSLAEFLLGEEGGGWLWLLAPLTAG